MEAASNLSLHQFAAILIFPFVMIYLGVRLRRRRRR